MIAAMSTRRLRESIGQLYGRAVAGRALLLAAVLTAVLTAGGSAPAQEASCTWPENPGGQIVGPDQVQLGETIGFGVEFDQPGEGNYAIDQVFDVDGPDGHVTLSEGQKLTPQTAGTYTVNGHWTETCGDGVTPDRTVNGRPLTVVVQGLQPPYAYLIVQDGARRAPALAQMRVRCDEHPLADPIQVIASGGGRIAAITRPKGCTAHSLSRSADRHGARWALDASDFDGRATTRAPARRTAHLELRSGGATVASFDVRFTPAAHHREHVSLAAKHCSTGPCQVLRLKPGRLLPPLFG
jgi:hypothetical protein